MRCPCPRQLKNHRFLGFFALFFIFFSFSYGDKSDQFKKKENPRQKKQKKRCPTKWQGNVILLKYRFLDQ